VGVSYHIAFARVYRVKEKLAARPCGGREREELLETRTTTAGRKKIS